MKSSIGLPGAGPGQLGDNCQGSAPGPNVPTSRAAWVTAGALFIACVHAQTPGGQSADEIKDRFRNAQKALTEHRYDIAEREFEAILNMDAGLAGAHANLGVARYLQADYGGAVKAFRRALELDPSIKNAELYLGLSQARSGNVEDALPSLSRGFRNASDDPWRLQAGLLLAELHAARQEDDKLLDVVRALKQAFPKDADVLYMAYRLYSDMGARTIADLVREAPDSARLHQVTAELLVSEGDYPRAMRQYRKALEIAPGLSGANRALAVAILNSNPDEAGIREAEQALELELSLNPRDAESLYQLGEIAWRHGDEDTALKRYSTAVEFEPRFAEGLIALGKALIARDEFDRAAEYLQDAVRIDSENEVAHYRLAQAYRQLGRMEEAAKELEEFRRIRSASEALGAIYRQVQRSTVPTGDIDTEGSQ